ncbi:MAG: hypothetical protein L3J24_07985 [Xanthomonadales bacterium]|nr:hypothetical protein [Xanthomonadales bacterium]
MGALVELCGLLQFHSRNNPTDGHLGPVNIIHIWQQAQDSHSVEAFPILPRVKVSDYSQGSESINSKQ